MTPGSTDRRLFLKSTLVGLLGLGSGCGTAGNPLDPRASRETQRALPPPEARDRYGTVRARATYGDDGSGFPQSEDGLEAWLEAQCRAPHETLGLWTLFTGSEEPGLRWRLGSIEALRSGLARPGGRTNPGFELRDISQPEILRQLSKAAVLRAAYSRWQLRERMVGFWSDHFNIYARKVAVARERKQTDAELMYLLPAEQNQVLRPHVLGNFRDLVRASMRSPAMLGYLDNHVSKKGKPNENYARELMELHTLGVDGGYTQADVRDVARCMTGWTIEDRFLQRAGSVRFDPALHDDGEKWVLGKRIAPGGGPEDADRVLDILCSHPSTARFIAQKLAIVFQGPPRSTRPLTEMLVKSFRETGGDLAATTTVLFRWHGFGDAPPMIKRPFDFLISAVRATGAVTDGDQGIQAHLEKMGQPLHLWPMPDGYPVDNASWEANLLPRWNFADALASNSIDGTRLEPSVAVERLHHWTSDPALSARERIAAALSSPEFQWN